MAKFSPRMRKCGHLAWSETRPARREVLHSLDLCFLSLAIRALVSIETNSLPLTAFYPSLALKWSNTKFEAFAPRAVISAALLVGGRMVFSLCEGFRHMLCSLELPSKLLSSSSSQSSQAHYLRFFLNITR